MSRSNLLFLLRTSHSSVTGWWWPQLAFCRCLSSLGEKQFINCCVLLWSVSFQVPALLEGYKISKILGNNLFLQTYAWAIQISPTLYRYLAGYEFKCYSDFLSVFVKDQRKQVRPIYLQGFAEIMTEWKNWTPAFPRPLSQNTILLWAEYRLFKKTWFCCGAPANAQLRFDFQIWVCCEVRSFKAKPTWAASFLSGVSAPQQEVMQLCETSCILPSPGHLLELKQCKCPAGWLHKWVYGGRRSH